MQDISEEFEGVIFARNFDRSPKSTKTTQRRVSSVNVKYQVFISSTFTDLVEQRQAVSRAVLELGHIPAGMELFPAFDQSQLEFIKRVIDDCDYYVIILGGRYGSLTKDGINFTEAEYEYALKQKKPIIALIHSNVAKIESGKVEKDSELVDKLNSFREKLQTGRVAKFWTDTDDLKSNAIISLTTSFDQMPQVGWRRDDGRDSEAILGRLESYRERNDSLMSRIREFRRRLGAYEDLDSAELDIKYSVGNNPRYVSVSADDLIREFAAPLKNGFSRDEIEHRLLSLIEHRHEQQVESVSQEAIDNVLLFFEVFEIAHELATDQFQILDDKVHLLKAAFRKRKTNENLGSVNQDNEIPF